MPVAEISREVMSRVMGRATDVWVNGKQLLKERELTTLKMEEIRAIAEKWDKTLKEFKASQQWCVC